MPLVKCLYCGRSFDRDKEPYVKPRSNRYAHASCAQEKDLEVINPLILKQCYYCKKEINIEEEEYKELPNKKFAHLTCWENNKGSLSDKEQLEEYIKKLFHEDFISPKIQKQITDYTTKNGCTYSGILKSLIYFYEIKGNSIEKANGGIGIVRYVYHDALRYYKALWEIQEANKNKKIEAYIPEVKEIIIKNPERKMKTKNLFSFLDEE